MGLNLPRLRRNVRRLLSRGYVSLESVTVRSWTVCPEARALCPPALHPPGAIEKIRGMSPYRNWPVEEQLIRGGEVVLPPTTGHLLRGVDVVNGVLYCGGCEWQAGVGEAPWWLPPSTQTPPLARATLETTLTGAEYFGCMLLDDFPMTLLAADPADVIALPSKPSGHEAAYREWLGLPARRTVQRGHVQELTVFKDPAYNASKTERYRRLRANFRDHMRRAGAQPEGAGRIYISRGMAGQRRVLANETRLEDALRRRGFTIVDPMKLSVPEIARLSLDAKVVVSIEGSQLSHAQYTLADDATLVVLQPPDRFCLQYKEYADALGMRFAFVVCEPVAEGGFSVDIDELLRLLDQIGA